MSYAIKLNTAQRYGQNLSLEIRGLLMAYNSAPIILQRIEKCPLSSSNVDKLKTSMGFQLATQ